MSISYFSGEIMGFIEGKYDFDNLKRKDPTSIESIILSSRVIFNDLPGFKLPALSYTIFSSVSLTMTPVWPLAIVSSYFYSASSFFIILPWMTLPSISSSSLDMGTLGSFGNANTASIGSSELFLYS
jgi:hypothetical protein